MKKIAIAATALALVASSLSVAPAIAAGVPAAKATVSTPCTKVNEVAKGRGADGSDLKCLVAKVGGYAGSKVWSYPTTPVVSALEFTIPASAGGGFDSFGRAAGAALKAEGLLASEPTFNYVPGAGNNPGLIYFLNNYRAKAGKIMVTGFAQFGGVYTTKSKSKVADTEGVARLMAEYEVFVVKADSPYKTMQDLVADIKSKPKSVVIAGGTAGGVDTYTVASVYDAVGAGAKNMNYVGFSGGGKVSAALLSDAKYSFGVSGWGEFQSFVESGKMRVLGISSPKRIAGISAPTFTEAGVKVVTQNWRGLVLPPNTSAKGYALVLRALDTMRASKSWKQSMTDNKWQDNYIYGNQFKEFIKIEQNRISNLFAELGL